MIIDCDVDRFVREVINKNEYSFLFNDLVILDVGCNIGTFSFWIYDLAKKIYAIDLSQKNIDKLKKNIETNKLYKINPYCFAIAGGSYKRYVNHEGEAGGGGWALTGHSDMLVEAFTLGDFMKHENIGIVDILKLDVEGAEFEILEAPDFPKDKIRTILGELHGDNGGERIRKILTSLGYRIIRTGNHFLARL